MSKMTSKSPVRYQKLDPRTRILLVLLLSILVFFVDKLPATVIMALGFLALRTALRIPFQNIKRDFRVFFALTVFIILLQLLFGPGQRYIVKPLVPQAIPFLGGMGSLKWDGLILGLIISCRLAALMVLFPVLTTAGPDEIAMGLNRLGLNYSACYILSAAINLIPVFEEEARSIMDAQKLRGMAAFEEGSFPDKIRAYPALAVPLVLGAMRRARLAGVAMDARAFGAYKTRTWLDKLKFKKADYLSFAACAVFTVLILCLNYALKQGNRV